MRNNIAKAFCFIVGDHKLYCTYNPVECKRHGIIKNIDLSEAETMPGVYKIMTAKDVKGTNSHPVPQIIKRMKADGILEFPIICGKKVNKRGDCVALVAADSEKRAREAAKKVKVEYEVLPSYSPSLKPPCRTPVAGNAAEFLHGKSAVKRRRYGGDF